MSKRKTEATIRRIRYLSDMLAKYAHRWTIHNNNEPSHRMQLWVDELEQIRATQPDAYALACERFNWDPRSTAYDALA